MKHTSLINETHNPNIVLAALAWQLALHLPWLITCCYFRIWGHVLDISGPSPWSWHYKGQIKSSTFNISGQFCTLTMFPYNTWRLPLQLLGFSPPLPPPPKQITGHSAFRYICINMSVLPVLGKCSRKKQCERGSWEPAQGIVTKTVSTTHSWELGLTWWWWWWWWHRVNCVSAK